MASTPMWQSGFQLSEGKDETVITVAPERNPLLLFVGVVALLISGIYLHSRFQEGFAKWEDVDPEILLFGLYCLFASVWMGFGREKIAVDTQWVSIRKDVLGLGFGQRCYDVNKIGNLRVEEGRRGLVFDYDQREIVFGTALSWKQSSAMFDALKKHDVMSVGSQ